MAAPGRGRPLRQPTWSQLSKPGAPRVSARGSSPGVQDLRQTGEEPARRQATPGFEVKVEIGRTAARPRLTPPCGFLEPQRAEQIVEHGLGVLTRTELLQTRRRAMQVAPLCRWADTKSPCRWARRHSIAGRSLRMKLPVQIDVIEPSGSRSPSKNQGQVAHGGEPIETDPSPACLANAWPPQATTGRQESSLQVLRKVEAMNWPACARC